MASFFMCSQLSFRVQSAKTFVISRPSATEFTSQVGTRAAIKNGRQLFSKRSASFQKVNGGLHFESSYLESSLVTNTFRKLVWRPNDFGVSRSRICLALIGPENGQTLFCLLVSCAAVAQVLERKSKWGAHLSAPLLAMVGGLILSSFEVIPKTAPVYDVIFSMIMPLAVALCLLETDVQLAFMEAGSTLKAFWLGAIATILGTLTSFKIVGSRLGPDGWKIASCLCSSYIGGSINYAATAQALSLSSGSILAAGMAADNLVMALYFVLIMSIPANVNQEKSVIVSDIGPCSTEEQLKPTVETISLSLSAATAACAIGSFTSTMLPSHFAGSSLALIALVASILSYVAARFSDVTRGRSIRFFTGSQIFGGALMLVFFSVVGATCAIKEAISGGWWLLIFILLLVGIHLTSILFLGGLCGIPRCMILIASNANIGGPATAAAMASARSWPGLVRPAILVGTLGYTIGTAIGCAVGTYCLKGML